MKQFQTIYRLGILLSAFLFQFCSKQAAITLEEMTMEQKITALIAQIKTIENDPDYSPTPVSLSTQEVQEWQQKMRDSEAVPHEAEEYGVIDTEHGVIVLEFYPDKAPNHVANFKKLANSGFYDWVTFHRIMPGFMIQGGDINSKSDELPNGGGNPGYNIDAEFNDISHGRGILSTARLGHDVNSAGSQFFIMHGSAAGLDGQYTVFGKVIYGMDAVDAIANQPAANELAIEKIYMKRVRVMKPDPSALSNE